MRLYRAEKLLFHQVISSDLLIRQQLQHVLVDVWQLQ